MQFLADVFVPCDQCDGKRFKPQVLEVRYRGTNIDQVLDLTVREALTFFSSSPKVLRRLQVLDEIGLGYLRLGQPATTLSGGEAQRIKIAAHLSSHGGERLLYILDEPTTGLHFDDIAKLLAAFRKLLEAGHTPARHRAQPRRDQDRRLHHRPRARRRRGRRRRGRDGHAGAGRRASRRRTPGDFSGARWPRSRAHAYRGRDRMIRATVAGLALAGARDRWPRGRRNLPRSAECAAGRPPESQHAHAHRRRCIARRAGAASDAAAPMAALLLDGDDDVQFAAVESLLNLYIVRADLAQAALGRPLIGRPTTLAESAFEAGPLATIPAAVPAEVVANLAGRRAARRVARIRLAAAYALGVLGSPAMGPMAPSAVDR